METEVLADAKVSYVFRIFVMGTRTVHLQKIVGNNRKEKSMSETTLGTLASIGLGICVVDCFLWMWGGRNGKYKRRFIGSALQGLGINILSLITGTWAWQFVVAIGPEIGSRCLGYGGDTTGEKIMRRTVFAAGSLAAGACLAWGAGFSDKAVTLLICQAVASVVSIILGVKNPLPASVEEVFVCLSLKYINYGYLFIMATAR